MSRPFEAGDFIRVARGCFDTIKEVNKKNGKIHLEPGGFVYQSDITVIRKPRKGCAESRAIVAMLMREMLNVRRATRRYCLEHDMNRTFKETTIFHQETFDLYERANNAKTMLK